MLEDLPTDDDIIHRMQMDKKSLAGQVIASEKGFDARQNTQILDHLFQKLSSSQFMDSDSELKVCT